MILFCIYIQFLVPILFHLYIEYIYDHQIARLVDKYILNKLDPIHDHFDKELYFYMYFNYNKYLLDSFLNLFNIYYYSYKQEEYIIEEQLHMHLDYFDNILIHKFQQEHIVSSTKQFQMDRKDDDICNYHHRDILSVHSDHLDFRHIYFLGKMFQVGIVS